MLVRDVVEDAVEGDPDASLVRCVDEVVEVVVVTEPRVDGEVVEGVVAVRRGGEDRPEEESVAAQVADVVEPPDQAPEPVMLARCILIADRGADEPERIGMPPDRVLGPPHVYTVHMLLSR